MSEETNELQTNSGSMDSAEFETRLTEFFSQHKESKLKLVPRILEEFKGHEAIVLEHLHNKYVLGIVAEKPKKKTKDHHASEAAVSSPPEGEKKPKSKKKLIIIIAAILLVAGLGAAGFLMKDKFLGKKEEPAKAETPAAPSETTPAAEQPKEDAAPVATTDSVPAAAPDSVPAGTDSANVQ